MKKNLPWVVLTFMLLAFPRETIAEILEIPLPVLMGIEPWEEHELDFDAGGPLDDLREVRLRLVGEAGGVVACNCMGTPRCGYLAGEIKVRLYRNPDEALLAGFTHDFSDDPREPFDLEWTFDLADPTVLAGGVGFIILTAPSSEVFFNGSEFICPIGNSCVLNSGTIIMEYGDPVATEETTWGALKAIYR